MATSFIEDIQTKPAEEKIFQPTWKDLRKANLSLSVPFEIQLTDHDVPLICDEIIRIVPGKRLVAHAMWGDKSVVAKLFYLPGHAIRHIERELDGIEELTEANIPTANLLWQGSAQKQNIQILIFEKIVNGCNLNELWENKGSIEELFPLMKAVTIELATQHVLGIVQRDLHLKNFFVTRKKIYTLDAGSVVSFMGILPREESINHLALFFAQLGVGTDELQNRLFKIYAKSRGWLLKKADFKLLQSATAKWNKKRWDRFKKKIQRNSSAFVYKKRWNELCVYDQQYMSEEFKKFLANPDTFFHNTQLLKDGRSSTVAKIRIDNQFFVLKRYNIKNFWHRLRRMFRPTRAARCWRLAQQFQLFGIPTAKPVAFIEKRFLGLRGKSYFLMEYIEGPHIGDYLTNPDNKEHFVAVAKRVLVLLNNLGKLSLSHGDLKMTNILISKERPFLIDLDGVVEHFIPFTARHGHRRAFKRFMRNWDQNQEVSRLFQKHVP